MQVDKLLDEYEEDEDEYEDEEDEGEEGEDDDGDGTLSMSDSRPTTAEWFSRPTTAHSHHSLFEDDPDIAMLKETRAKLAKLKVEEEERKKEERKFFKDRALSIAKKQEQLRVEDIQEMINNHALAKQKEKGTKMGPDGAPPPPMPPAAGDAKGRPRKKKKGGVSSPEVSSPELSPRGGPAEPRAGEREARGERADRRAGTLHAGAAVAGRGCQGDSH